MGFRAIVVRHDHSKIENFFRINRLSSDLFDGETWKRNKIVNVQVIADSVAFVAESADKLKKLMSSHGLGRKVDPVPKKVEDRVAASWNLKLAPKITEHDLRNDATTKLAAAKLAQDNADRLAAQADDANGAIAQVLKEKAQATADAAKEAAELAKIKTGGN